MRLPRITLATKYRILFGAAVVLIIGSALAVPWYTVELLVLQQPFREAQRVVESYFRHVMPNPDAGSGVHGERYSLFPDMVMDRVRYMPLDAAATQPAVDPNSGKDEFMRQATSAFRTRADKDFFYRTRWDDNGQVFQYAQAVWVTRRCLNCHDVGRGATPYRENQLAGILRVDIPTAQSTNYAFMNRAVLVAAGILAGVLAILVFYVITTRFILAPIDELRGVALRVSDGDLTVRSSISSGDEFEQLSDNFNTMLERLRDSQDDLKRANRLLDEKLGQMAESNVALFESNRVKSEFLANVSHELKTPLTSIIGFAELLREGSPAAVDPRVLRYAENILISGRILLEIINDLLDLAKIEANRIELRIETVSVTEVCATLVDFMRPLADKKSIKLQLEMDEGLPTLATDRGRLRQILFNLLSNAIKFTPDGGQVWVRGVREDGERLRLTVQDSGPGIAAEFHQVIFEKFRQADQSATREHQGTGLGLAIAKELTFLLGGEIGVESELGHGALFWLVLPIAAPEHRERPLVSLV